MGNPTLPLLRSKRLERTVAERSSYYGQYILPHAPPVMRREGVNETVHGVLRETFSYVSHKIGCVIHANPTPPRSKFVAEVSYVELHTAQLIE